MSDADVSAPNYQGESFEQAGLRRTVEYRLGRSRLVGRVGYAHSATGLDPHEVSGAAAVQLGHPTNMVGAGVSVPF